MSGYIKKLYEKNDNGTYEEYNIAADASNVYYKTGNQSVETAIGNINTKLNPIPGQINTINTSINTINSTLGKKFPIDINFGTGMIKHDFKDMSIHSDTNGRYIKGNCYLLTKEHADSSTATNYSNGWKKISEQITIPAGQVWLFYYTVNFGEYGRAYNSTPKDEFHTQLTASNGGSLRAVTLKEDSTSTTNLGLQSGVRIRGNNFRDGYTTCTKTFVLPVNSDGAPSPLSANKIYYLWAQHDAGSSSSPIVLPVEYSITGVRLV